MGAWLEGGNRKLDLGEDPVTLGRELGCDFVFEDEVMSRRHAMLVPSKGRHLLVDLNSSNGVTVNGERVMQRLLEDGDDLGIGTELLRYRNDGEEESPSRVSRPVKVPSGAKGKAFESLSQDRFSLLLEGPKLVQDDTLRLAILYHVNRLVGGLTDLDSLCRRVTKLALEVFHADRSILLFGADAESLVVKESRMRGDKPVEGNVLQFSTSIARSCAEERKPLLTADTQADPRFNQAGSVQMMNIRCALAAPLVHAGKFYGVLYLDNRLLSHEFAREDLKMLEAFASQVALALENAALYRSLEAKGEELRRQQALQARHDKLATVGQLVAGVARSLRNPLTVISSYTTMIRNRPTDHPRMMEYLDAVLKGAEAIQRVMTGLLDFSRRGGGRREPVALNELLAETIELARAAVVDCEGVEIRRVFEEPLPAVWVDRGLLKQAFLSLLTRGGRVCPEGEALIVETASVANDAGVVIHVRDAGPPIPPEAAGSVFQPIFSGGGTEGLELAVVKEIVDQHEGDVTLASGAGRGTTFTVTLPVGAPKNEGD